MDSELIPLSDKQTDRETIGELGHSFWPADPCVSEWAGYRWREPNEPAQRDPPDEAFYLARIGSNPGRAGGQLTTEGMTSVSTPVT